MLFENDIPDEVYEQFRLSGSIALDTETLGLKHTRDRLCLVQIMTRDGAYAAVRLHKDVPADESQNLRFLLSDPAVKKIIHFGRFDVKAIKAGLDTDVPNIFCTKVAAKITCTWMPKHGLADLEKGLLNLERDKSQGTTYWGGDDLSESQLLYAKNDVVSLHPLKDEILRIAQREGRLHLIEMAMAALPAIIALELEGHENVFEH